MLRGEIKMLVLYALAIGRVVARPAASLIAHVGPLLFAADRPSPRQRAGEGARASPPRRLRAFSGASPGRPAWRRAGLAEARRGEFGFYSVA